MVGCWAVGCSNRSDQGYRMHRFPVDAQRKAVWVQKVGRRDETSKAIKESKSTSLLCQEHFELDQYECTRVDGSRRLRSSAVPTLFSHRSAPKRRKVPKERTSTDRSSQVGHSVASDHTYSFDTEPEVASLPDAMEAELQSMDVQMVNSRIKDLSKELASAKDELAKERAEKMRLKRHLEQSQQNVGKVFSKDQLLALSRQSSQGMQWSDDTVRSALQLRFACGTSGYEAIIQQQLPYPSLRTLQRRLHGISFTSGILEDVFSFMKMKAQTMVESERKCCLTLDEMALRSSIDYDPSSKAVIGNADLPGCTGIATQAYVFMLAAWCMVLGIPSTVTSRFPYAIVANPIATSGITSRWKQTVAYYFSGANTNGRVLADISINIIAKAHEIGLDVIAITSDMGPSNQAMWKKFGVKAGRTELCCQIAHPSKATNVINVLADVPHLIKNFRQAFLSHKTITVHSSTVKKHNLPSNIISIFHVKDLLEFQKSKDLKLAPKLTDVILSPSQYDKMKVSQALNLFSRAVSSGLHYLVEKEGRGKSYLTTAWFINTINHWFDLMSSRHPVMALSKQRSEKYSQAITFLKSTIDDVSKLSFTSGHWKPVQTGINLSTSSVIALAERLLDTQPYLLTARLSQDCLENLFSTIRLKGPTPSPKEFKAHLKLITVAQYLRCRSNTNYNMDESAYLADLLSAPATTEPVDNEELEIESCEQDIGEDEENAIYYLAGYCVRSVKRTQLSCNECLQIATTDRPPEDVGFLTLTKEYKEGALCHPSMNVYDQCRIAEDCIRSCEHVIIGKPNIVSAILNQQSPLPQVAACHPIIENIVKKYIELRIKILCKKLTKSHAASTKRSYASKSVAMRHSVTQMNKIVL